MYGRGELKAKSLNEFRCRRLQRRHPAIFELIIDGAATHVKDIRSGLTADELDDAQLKIERNIVDAIIDDKCYGTIQTQLINWVVGFVVKLLVDQIKDYLEDE